MCPIPEEWAWKHHKRPCIEHECNDCGVHVLDVYLGQFWQQFADEEADEADEEKRYKSADGESRRLWSESADGFDWDRYKQDGGQATGGVGEARATNASPGGRIRSDHREGRRASPFIW